MVRVRGMAEWKRNNIQIKKGVLMPRQYYFYFNTRLISKDNEKIYNRAGRFYLSDEFKAFEESIACQAKKQYHDKPLAGDLFVALTASFKTKKHPDTSNLPKSCLDALSGIVYIDDRQIKELSIRVIEGTKEDYFEIWVHKRD
jgi:Holliday junction resolvase RusA-like endonuclease